MVYVIHFLKVADSGDIISYDEQIAVCNGKNKNVLTWPALCARVTIDLMQNVR